MTLSDGDNFLTKQYFRGPLVIRAAAIEKELEQVSEPSVNTIYADLFTQRFFYFNENFLRDIVKKEEND